MDKFQELLQVGLKIEEEPRVVTDRVIYIFGYRLDFDDLYECMGELTWGESSVYLTDSQMVEALKLIGVIESTSPSWGTRTGPNYQEFYKLLEYLDND